MMLHHEAFHLPWMNTNSCEDLSSLCSSTCSISDESFTNDVCTSESLCANSWDIDGKQGMGQEFWHRRCSLSNIPSNAVSKSKNEEFDKSFATHSSVGTKFPSISSVKIYDSVRISKPLNRKNSNVTEADDNRLMYLSKLKQNTRKLSEHTNVQGMNPSLQRQILPNRVSFSKIEDNSERKSKRRVSDSPIPLRATIHRSTSGRNRVRNFYMGDDTVDSFKVINDNIEDDIETFDLDDNENVDVSVNEMVVDAVVSLSAKGVRSSKMKTNQPVNRKCSSYGDISSSVQNVDEENPFGNKPVLVKSPSLSKIRQRLESRVVEMGNNTSHNGDSATFEDKEAYPFIDNSRRIRVVGRGSNGFASKSELDSSQSSGQSIISVSHAGSPTTTTKNHLPEVEWRNRRLYHKANSFVAEPKINPVVTTSHIVKSQQKYHPPNDSYEDDFESSSSSSIEERLQDPMNFSISKITRDKLLMKQGQLMKQVEERKVALNKQNYTPSKTTIPSRSQSITFDPPRRSQTSHPVPSRSHVPRKAVSRQTPGRSQSVRSRSLAPANRHKYQAPRSQSIERRPDGYDSRGKESHRSLSDSSAGFSIDRMKISPVNSPNEALKSALRSMSSDNWTVKVEGIQMLLSVTTYHHNVLISDLHNIVLALNAEVKNLRSSVSRLAIHCMGEMFVKLKRNLDHDLELIARTLFHKSGENSGFIREDVEKALMNMINNVSPNKAVFVIVVAGATHRNGAVRKVAALCLWKIVEKVGATKILGGTKDFSEKVLPTAAQFLLDGNPMTRYYAKKTVYILMNHHNFERCLHKYVQTSTLRNINSALESLKLKGVGECPLESTSSAKSRKQELHSRGSSNLSKTM